MCIRVKFLSECFSGEGLGLLGGKTTFVRLKKKKKKISGKE